MDSETARRVYRQVESTKCLKLKKDMFGVAVLYARLRTDWRLADSNQRREMDNARKVAHDALLDACNILARNMSKAAEDASWRAVLGERKDIGDFACYIHCFLGLDAR